MIRSPRAVAKSQERLKRRLMIQGKDGQPFNALEGLTVHTPQMYIHVHLAAARWILKNEPAIKLVHYDELIEKPGATLADLGTWLGEDLSPAASLIEPKLRRSEPEPYDHELWDDADAVYERLKSEDFQGIVDYFDNGDTRTARSARQWHCPRVGGTVTEKDCSLCRSNSRVRSNFRATAIKRAVNWRSEPCAWEVAMDCSIVR